MPLQEVVATDSRTTATSPSDDESDDTSFVSAEVNTSPQRAQSAHSDKAPHSAVSTSPSHDAASDISSNPSSADLKAQRTPIARKHTAFFPISKPSPLSTVSQATSYFRPHPAAASSFEARSPPNRRAPASRSSHGIETRSGPPPALITQRSYNADSPWRRHSQTEPINSESFESSNDSSIDSVLQTTQKPSGDMNGLGGRRDRRNRRSLDITGLSRRSMADYEADQDHTVRPTGRHAQSSSFDLGSTRQQQEDLFLNLARSDPLEEQESDSRSTTTRRQVSPL